MKKLAFIFVFVAFSAFAHGSGHNPKLSDELAAKDPAVQCNVIVQWIAIPTEASHQKVLSRGGTVRRRYAKLPFGAYSISSSALLGLANDPEVSFIAPDRALQAKLDYTAAAVNASVAWSSNLTGSGIGIALIDSGVNTSADLSYGARIVYSQDFTSAPIAGAPDLFGHGEHVAGILAGNGTLSSCAACDRTLKGIAPGANIINLRALDQNGAGIDSTVMAAIDTAIALAPTYKIRVMNLSLGRPFYESYKNDPLCQAVEQAWKAGIVVVVAAGNDGRDNSFGNNGYGTIEAPGNDPFVITVGAMKTQGTYSRTNDLIASYSAKGPTLIDGIVKPDLVAPGNKVVSLLASPEATLAVETPGNIMPVSYYQHGNNSKPADTFFMLSGTSMAAPVVSAAAALLLQANPAMTPDQVKARLMLTAYKKFPAFSVATDPATGMSYVSYYDIFTVGAGYLDIGAALTDKSLGQGTAHSPTAVYDSSDGAVGLMADPASVWNLKGIWGLPSAYEVQAVWGTNSIDASRSRWSFSTVYDASAASSDSTGMGVGVNLNKPSAQSMSSGVPVQPSASVASQATALSIAINGEN